MSLIEKIKKSIIIDSNRQNVWKSLTEIKYYQDWTNVFPKNMYPKTDWKKGSKVIFGESTKSSMKGEISELQAFAKIVIKYKRTLEKGSEATSYKTPKAEVSADCSEIYTLSEKNGKTTLTVDIDTTKENSFLISKAWDKALLRIKINAENL